jgi:hypothetical protein
MSQELSFSCPQCGRVSYHADDVLHGYCGACHQFTGVGAAAGRTVLGPLSGAVFRGDDLQRLVRRLGLTVAPQDMSPYERAVLADLGILGPEKIVITQDLEIFPSRPRRQRRLPRLPYPHEAGGEPAY